MTALVVLDCLYLPQLLFFDQYIPYISRYNSFLHYNLVVSSEQEIEHILIYNLKITSHFERMENSFINENKKESILFKGFQTILFECIFLKIIFDCAFR